MRAALITEYRKLVTTRTWWVLLLVMAAYMAFLGAVMAFSLTVSQTGANDSSLTSGTPQTLSPRDVVTGVYTLAASLGYIFPVLVGALSVTGEVRHRTLTPTLLAEPRRTLVVGAKLLSSIPLGLLYGIVGTGASIAAGATVLALRDHPTLLGDGVVLRTIALTVVAVAVWCVVGVGFGAALPHQVAAVVVLLAFTQFVEPLLRVLLAQFDATAGVSRFLPGAAGEALSGGSIYSASGIADVLPAWQGALVLIAYALVFAVIGRFTTFRRDIS